MDFGNALTDNLDSLSEGDDKRIDSKPNLPFIKEWTTLVGKKCLYWKKLGCFRS